MLKLIFLIVTTLSCLFLGGLLAFDGDIAGTFIAFICMTMCGAGAIYEITF